MPDARDEFAELLERLRAGDETALTRLVTQYEGVLRRTAHALLGPALRPHLDSVDLVQSVHRSLLIGLRRQKFHFSTPEELVALALTMVRRKAARHWRRLQRQPDAAGASPTAGLLPALPGSDADPAKVAEGHDEISRFLNALEPLDRRLLELRLEGHSTVEAARALGVEPGMLRVRLTRLRKRLRESGLLDERA